MTNPRFVLTWGHAVSYTAVFWIGIYLGAMWMLATAPKPAPKQITGVAFQGVQSDQICICTLDAKDLTR